MADVTLGENTYTVRPMNVARSTAALQIVVKYMGKSGPILKRFIETGGVDEVRFSLGLSGRTDSFYERLADVITEAAAVVSEDEFSIDLISFLHHVSGIDRQVLADADMVALMDALPTIFEAAYFMQIVKRWRNDIARAFTVLMAGLPGRTPEAAEVSPDEPEASPQELEAVVPPARSHLVPVSN